MDLPQLTEDQPAHRPLVRGARGSWPGEMAVFRSASTDGFELLTSFGMRAPDRQGALVSDLYAGPTSRFDLGNALVVDLLTGPLESVTDLTLFGGANALAIESAPGVWEIVQAGAAELLAPGRYRLTRLLRGQRGTEGAMGDPAPAGRAGGGAGRQPRVAADRRGRSRHPVELARRARPRPSGQRRDLCRADPSRPKASGCGRSTVAHVEQPWRTAAHARATLTIRWTAPVPVARGRQLGRGRRAARRGNRGLRGRDSRRRDGEAGAEHGHHQCGLHLRQQTADWGAPLGPAINLTVRIFHLFRPRGTGRAQVRHAELLRHRNEFWQGHASCGVSFGHAS